MKAAILKHMAAISLFLVAASATATSAPPAPAPSSTTPITTNAASTAGAGAESAATIGDVLGSSVGNVTGGSTGPVSASGGAGGSGGAASVGSVTGGQGGTSASTSAATAGDSSASAYTGSSYSASGAQTGSITDASSSKYLSLSLPQPVWTSVPTAFGCLVTESKAGAVGWNFLSASSTRQVSDTVCTTIRMAEAAALHCHFASAAHLNKRAFEQMHAGASGEFFMAGNPQNLDPVSCDDLKRPKLRAEPALQQLPATATVNVLPASCPAATPKTAATYRPAVRKANKKPTCSSCCNS